MCVAVLLGGTVLGRAQTAYVIYLGWPTNSFNYQSQRGVPINTVSNGVAGSDGRMPTSGNVSTFAPTANQFAGFYPVGGVPALTNGTGSGSWQSVSNNAELHNATGGGFSSSVATDMACSPLGRDAAGTTVLLMEQRVQIGGCLFSRAVTINFGDIIGVPLTDENGLNITNISPSAYWQPAPYTNTGSYYSPHSKALYATQSGPIAVTWMTAAYTNGVPADYSTNAAAYYLVNGNYFKLYPQNYVVSSVPSKNPQKIYWTEGVFSSLSYPVVIPSSRVGAIKICYNNSIPTNVSSAYVDTSVPLFTTNTIYQETRTFWYDQIGGSLHCYNSQGRVLIEILGDINPDGRTRVSLGVEVIDVYKYPSPIDITAQLGDRLTPSDPTQLSVLMASPVITLGGSGTVFGYQNINPAAPSTELYAAAETKNLNDYLVYWLTSGAAGILWPSELSRYRLVWPSDPGRYSHYVRPLVVSDSEASATAVQLSTSDSPVLQYQDMLDKLRGKLTATFQYYSWLDLSHPAHRALIRYSSGNNIAFERVFSWLDTSLLETNFTLPNYTTSDFSGLSSTNLTGNANITNGVLHLLDALNWQTNTFKLPDLAAGGTISSFQMDFLALVGGGTSPGADGFSVNLAPGSATLSSEEGAVTGLSVCFDLYDNGTNDFAPGITIKTNNVTIAAVSMNDVANTYADTFVSPSMLPAPIDPATRQAMTLDTAGAYVPVRIVLSPAGLMDVTYKGVKVLSGVPTGYGPVTNQSFTFAARTGGSYANVWFDALSVVINGNGISSLAGSVATNLNSWIAANTLNFTNSLTTPRVVRQTVNVGDRINPPSGESTFVGSPVFPAGYIRTNSGNLFSPFAYVDPFVAGLQGATNGAIIPVNAIPGKNQLEVWWFRPNSAQTSLGFTPAYWPSVVGYYSIQYPTNNPKEIVLASNKGSAGNGWISPNERLGAIYTQPDPTQPGYNPNEEHAMMSAGTAYALRDDLNNTNSGAFTSQPFVLVKYLDVDGRPSMTAYKVRREKPEAGFVFDYPVSAGTLLQAPMPLPLLAPPLDANGLNKNTEPVSGDGDLPGQWNAAQASGIYSNYLKFTYEDRKHNLWVYRGPHAGLPPLSVGTYVASSLSFVSLSSAAAVVGQPFNLVLHSSRQPELLGIATNLSTGIPAWLTVNGLTLSGTPLTANLGTNTLRLVVKDNYDSSLATNVLTLVVSSSGFVVAQGPVSVLSTNSYTGTVATYTNRAPFLALSTATNNCFTMQYFYPNDPSYDWPGLSAPAFNAPVPYLLTPQSNGSFKSADAVNPSTAPLRIVYRPYWPESDPSNKTQPIPAISYGTSLVRPQASDIPYGGNLPGVGDWESAQVLYQQSIATNLTTAISSVILFDPTREKTAALAKYNVVDANGLPALPPSVVQSAYQGKVYFPKLPPHLAQRFWYDPNRGSLVFVGQFHADPDEPYVSLNVLSGSDLTNVVALCNGSDSLFQQWSNAVCNLSTTVVNFQLSTNGVYYPGTASADNVAYGVTQLAQLTSDNMAADSKALSASGPGCGYITLVEAGGGAFTKPGDPVALHILRVGGALHAGKLKIISPDNPLSEMVTFQHSVDMGGNYGDYEYQWKIAAPIGGQPPVTDALMSVYLGLVDTTNVPLYVLGGAGVQALGDNYVTLRYRPVNSAHPLFNTWSSWTSPVLAQGWIKRVMAGINPFNQRTSDLYNNSVNTSGSMLTQAGARWEGDVALNQATLNNYGLIQIYETVLRRGRALSIESGYDYGPANQALLLAAGYISDLYMLVGNESWADAANPTIGIGTDNANYGSIATSLFSFMGQEPSLLEEELALLRGRDDITVPGVQTPPVYNRLVWNFTGGLDGGQTIYQQNYNILDQNADGVVNASDAAILYPQGHGDAYGHYLTSLCGYYSLLMNPNFDWVPQAESVNILGMPVSVNYMHERKFAASAVSLATAGRQIFDLTWRRDYLPGHATGWANLSPTSVNNRPTVPTRKYWGALHWASRTAQGSYVNWLAGNAILPDHDLDPTHTGTIQQVDRTTVPELTQLATMSTDLQAALDNALAGLNPVGLSPGSVALDIDPNQVVGGANGTHFEQIYNRALVALNNAVASFDDAKNVTQLMRSQEDSLAGLQSQVAAQEQAFTNSLIELYGSPYTDDIGPGQTYSQGYAGPDLFHYMYADDSNVYDPPGNAWAPNTPASFSLDFQLLPSAYDKTLGSDASWLVQAQSAGYQNNIDANGSPKYYVSYNYTPNGFWQHPSSWNGSRSSPGKLQQAVSTFLSAQNHLYAALCQASSDKEDLDKELQLFNAQAALFSTQNSLQSTIDGLTMLTISGDAINESISLALNVAANAAAQLTKAAISCMPTTVIAGLAFGGDQMKAAMLPTITAAQEAEDGVKVFTTNADSAWAKLKSLFEASIIQVQSQLNQSGQNLQLQQMVVSLASMQKTVQGDFTGINYAIQNVQDSYNNFKTLAAQGDRLQMERKVVRQSSAALVQGFRNRDAAFRVFRNEKLERYKTLFDLATRYAFLAANAYDYETGLLNTDAGRKYINKIVSSRALGVVQNGQPQFGGSANGDPGLSTALAQMKADWDVVKGRLGFNNPDAYGTTASLRVENYRISPDTNGLANWQDVLLQHRVADLMADADVSRYCMQLSQGPGVAVPGIILDFSTTIATGYNLFGQAMAAGDHNYSTASFATKIFGAGVALVGYRGMDAPPTNLGSGGITPPDPSFWYLDPLALDANPYVYLIPCGQDSMRTPPLGDTSTIRTYSVDDVAIPLPFNIGASQFASSGFYQSSDSLSQPLFGFRKFQPFRPVPDPSFFSQTLYGSSGSLLRSQYTNNRLIGRSVWNSKWKLVIPGNVLLSDPTTGLDRFIKTVTDIKLHFDTYSYSGN